MFVVLTYGGLPSYLCGWCAQDGTEGSGWFPTREGSRQVPVWTYERSQAIPFDEETARRLADEMRARYRGPASNVQVYVESS